MNLSPVTKLIAGTGAAMAEETITEPEIYQGAGLTLCADAGIRVHVPKRMLLVPAEVEMKVKD